jgi:hypothetical protein
MDPNVFKAVMAVGRRMGASRKQLLAAAETGLVESGFTNPSAMTDHDSQGWRQERRSLYPNPTNVQASAARFFQEAKQHDQPGLSAGDLAAAVQRPAAQYRGRYSQAEARAAALLGMKGGDVSAQAASSSGGGSTTTNLPGATFKTTVPTVDQPGFEQARRNAIIGQLIARRNPQSILLRSGLLSTTEPSLSEFMGQQTTTSRVPGRTVTVPGAPSGSASFSTPPAQSGVASFEGKKVAAWIKPALVYARQHGWKGTVNSGVRSFADQQRIYNSGVRPAAKPGTSNHEGTQFPRGAVDVSDAATLAAILQRSPYGKRLKWAGAKDPVHFSFPHGGSY